MGTSGYVVNLAVYTALLHAGLHFRLAAVVSFVVSATSNYLLNRAWTFRAQRGHFAHQGIRFLVVSVLALAANQAWLTLFVWLGASKIVAQAVSIVLMMPFSFLGNKLWSFRRDPRVCNAVGKDFIMRRRPITLALAAVVAAGLAYSAPVSPLGWSQSAHFALVQALDRGTAHIDHWHSQTGDVAWVKGHYHAAKAPGPATISVPFYGAWGQDA